MSEKNEGGRGGRRGWGPCCCSRRQSETPIVCGRPFFSRALTTPLGCAQGPVEMHAHPHEASRSRGGSGNCSLHAVKKGLKGGPKAC